jgi:hypothetical protein
MLTDVDIRVYHGRPINFEALHDSGSSGGVMSKDKTPTRNDILRDFTVWQQEIPDAIYQNSIFIAGISPAGTYTLFRQEFFEKHGRNPATIQALLQAREEIDKKIKELQQ